MAITNQSLSQAEQLTVATKDASIAANAQYEAAEQRANQLLEESTALLRQYDAANFAANTESEKIQARALLSQAESKSAEVRVARAEADRLQQTAFETNRAFFAATQNYNSVYEQNNGSSGTAPQAQDGSPSASSSTTGTSPSPQTATSQVAGVPPGQVISTTIVPTSVPNEVPFELDDEGRPIPQTFAVRPQPVVVAQPLGSGPPDTSLLGRTPPVVAQPFGAGPPDTSLLINPVPPPPPLVAKPPVVNDPPDPAAAGAERSEQTSSETSNRFVFDSNGELLPADNPYVIAQTAEEQTQSAVAGPPTIVPQPVGGDYVASYNPETGKYDVVDLATGLPVSGRTGLSEQAATLDAQNLSVGDPGYGGLAARNFGVAYDDDGFLLPGYTLDENNDPVYVGGDFVEPSTAASAEASRIEALKQQAQQQATVSAQRKAAGKAAGDGDWRVRLRLAPNATYLYKTPGIGSAGIMEPLRNTDGVVFPYTPKIDITYSAEYNAYDLVHSNYRGYFYKGSRVGEVVMNADFTAQDSNEADYLLAVIHFFRSATKMFYGQDKQRGTPPPLVFLSGLGEFQFNEHPCVISQFNYSLPSDVDYIRSRGRQSTSSGVTQGGNGLMFRRTLSSSTTPSYSLSSIWSRLTGANLPQGGMNIPPAPPNLGLNSPTYVPTKMSMSLTLLPMPTRSQVSQQFSLEKFANGNGLRGGFW